MPPRRAAATQTLEARQHGGTVRLDDRGPKGGLLAAILVTSRKPCAARPRRVSRSPDATATSRSALDAICGTWLSRASSASWTPGSMAIGFAPQLTRPRAPVRTRRTTSRSRRQDPPRALEEHLVRRLDPVALRAAMGWPPTNASPNDFSPAATTRPLALPDVGHDTHRRRPRPQVAAHLGHAVDRHGKDDETRSVHRRGRGRGRRGDGTTRDRTLGLAGSGVVAHDRARAGGLQREADRAPDEPGAQDRDVTGNQNLLLDL